MEAIIRANGEHSFGKTTLTEMNGVHSEMLMDFEVLRLREGESYTDTHSLEKAFLLVYGKVRFLWEQESHEQDRANCFDVRPTALHVCKSVSVTIECLSDECEINLLRTDNEREFASKLYLPQDTPDEFRGAGTMREASTRIVRTIFDYRNAPYANLVLGEVIGFPGKWSSYPPHHHPQPEIYYYKTNPQNGFAYAELGEDVVKVHNNDTVLIAPGLTHPQSTPPGYALWYLWGIRHLEGNPYGTPTFVKEHLWVQDEDAVYWGDQYAGR
ncbi:MAG: 5-deoxy-glucuronate isomerase [Eubacteriales bacterium]|nr:5-deoxy-glucuronate isomerase [Eubacteriales bacterium]